MRVVICDTAAEATERVAALITGALRDKPDTILGLATGGTMEPLYRALVAAHDAGLSFAHATTFNLDEYVGLAPNHPQSYAHYMRRHLFEHVDIAPVRCFLPSGLGDPAEASRRYEDLLSTHGPIDLQLLGIGHNGHIGFNEPGSALTSLTREKALSRTTLKANQRFFDDPAAMPQTAITMGIGSICRARAIVLLALGPEKSRPVRAMIEGPLSAFCPASALQLHRNVTVVLDPGAAAGLELRDHYTFAERIQRAREKGKRLRS
ncbi:MAG: glucosamine-6-phosphate deaminase [Pseudomonadota bacterium]